ncbi:orotidine-5'-phosphate decarboxylase [Candidatus Woesearchaeota archaeon]|nr:orotidine-5'-phosphate decarboxylase [Candidatus Woesearchaeota archaeon]
MNFTTKLRKSAEKNNSIVCLGMDPVIEKIPFEEKNNGKKIIKFYGDIIEAVAGNVSAVKPNYAFFAQYGFPGLRALKKVIGISRKKKLPVILDAKRGDIGKSSEAYAREVFDFWKADAVTVSPYMGTDSVEPFISRCSSGKGVYVLVRTSNTGASDLQEIISTNGKKMLIKVAEKVVEWHKDGVGAVVGATNPEELKNISEFFSSAKKSVPLLIPGVGSQGGSAKEVAAILKNIGDIKIHRINSSSGINYAYKKNETNDYAGAAARAVKELNEEITL